MARRRASGGHSEVHADERWLITYADMITLLLALFITLYALSDTNMHKFVAFAQSLAAAFNTDIFAGERAFTVTAGQESAPDVAQFDAGSGIVADYRALQATITDYAIERGLAGQVSVEPVAEGIAIRISSSLLFQRGRATLAPETVDVVDRVAQALAPLPNAIRIEGHTDNLPPEGTQFRDNWRLSVARALAVLERLVGDGLDPGRLSAAGYGEHRPIASNADEAGRARNRRVDILVLYPDRPLDGSSPTPIGSLEPIGEPILPAPRGGNP
jgi:chemotaxis protein MotB